MCGLFTRNVELVSELTHVRDADAKGARKADAGMDMYIPLSLKLCHLGGCRLRAETRALVRDAILQSFYALRETFLEELDLEEPDHSLLISGGRRAKVSGSTGSGRRRQERQRARQDRVSSSNPRIDQLLAELTQKEEQTAKPWRQPPASAPAAPANGRAS
jgi:hypothetical protein